MIGLTGAHRTGKTTLARAYASQTKVPYETISASEVIAAKGWECKNIRDPQVRIDVQAALVEECDRVFSRHRSAFISDRTPLDVAAYLMADMGQDRLPAELEQRALDLTADCIDITNAFFGALLALPIALPFKAELGKPEANATYQHHVQLLIQGLLHDPRLVVNHWFLSGECLDLQDRVRVLGGIYGKMVEDHVYVSEVVTRH